MSEWPDGLPLLYLQPGETPLPVHPMYASDALVTHYLGNSAWRSFVHCGPVAPLPARMIVVDHPHTDPGDGRTECETCGKFVWLVTHSCKRVPVTDAARARAALHGRSVTITPGVWTSVAGGVAVIHHEPGPVTVRVIATPTTGDTDHD